MLLIAVAILLLSVSWIVARISHKHLPAIEPKIVDFKLADQQTSTLRTFRVEVVYEVSMGKHALLVFPLTERDKSRILASKRYSELQQIFQVGRTARLHYVPGLRWLGVFPEVTTLGSDLAFALLAGFVSAAVALVAVFTLFG